MNTARRSLAAVVVASTLVLPVASLHAADAAAKPRVFKNCKQMNKVYPHGVGKKGAVDSTSGTPVTNFKRSNKIYKVNKKRDRDKDKIACERH